MGLIELLGGEVEKLRFQKLLFLYAMKKQQPEYDFVPYKYGCYSYTATADMNAMVRRGYLTDANNTYSKMDAARYLQNLKSADHQLLRQVVADYGKMSRTTLVKHTYLNFPFYAIKSTIAKDVLPGPLYDRVEQAQPTASETTLFTIGYEGISLEMYLQKLIRNNVKLLVDVRKNPLSMKFGFSKTLLKRYTESLGIGYVHIPELGIVSEKRKSLDTQADYDALFADYRNTTLKESHVDQKHILSLLYAHKRIALTCFEAQPCQCHRSHLANAIKEFPEFTHPVIHL